MRTYHLTKVLNAPVQFAYDWCTDFQVDDRKITGSKNKRKILEKTKEWVIYAIRYKSGGKVMNAVNIVTLHPPRAWHLDSRGEEGDTLGEYRLSKLGPRRTKLDMTFIETWKVKNYPSRADYLKDIHRIWDKYATALARDYRKRK